MQFKAGTARKTTPGGPVCSFDRAASIPSIASPSSTEAAVASAALPPARIRQGGFRRPVPPSAHEKSRKKAGHTQGKRRKGNAAWALPSPDRGGATRTEIDRWRGREATRQAVPAGSRQPPPDGLTGAELQGTRPFRLGSRDWITGRLVPPRRCAHAANPGEAKQAAAGGGELERSVGADTDTDSARKG